MDLIKIEKFIRKWSLLIILFVCIICTNKLILSFDDFYNHINDLGTDKEWKFYFTLIALGIDFFFFLISIIALIFRLVYKDKFKMNISDENKII